MKDLKPFDFDAISAKEAIEMLSRPWQHFFSAKLFVSHLGVLNVEDEVELHDKTEIRQDEQPIVSKSGI